MCIYGLPGRWNGHGCHAQHLLASASEHTAGAVGIEGLSRGCREAHFVELDPRVARAVLEPNLATCDVTRAASVHVMVRFLRWLH